MSTEITNPDKFRRMKKLLRQQRGLCSLCGELVSLEEATFDHILPKSRGGSGRIENLAIAHRGCNLAKGNHYDGNPAPKQKRNPQQPSKFTESITLAVAKALKNRAPKPRTRKKAEAVVDCLRNHPSGATEAVIAVESGLGCKLVRSITAWMECRRMVVSIAPDDPALRGDVRQWKWRLAQ